MRKGCKRCGGGMGNKKASAMYCSTYCQVKAWREKHKLHLASLAKRWAATHRSRSNEFLRRWRHNNPSAVKDHQARWRLSHADVIKSYSRLYYDRHRVALIDKSRKYREAHIYEACPRPIVMQYLEVFRKQRIISKLLKETE